MALNPVYATLNTDRRVAKIGQSDDAVPNTTTLIAMPVRIVDPRLNLFLDGSEAPKMEICRPTGPWGQPGAGELWKLSPVEWNLKLG
jgi:hypothetical protein